MTAKIFISYARQDKATAKTLYSDLLKAGFRPRLDSEDLLPGQQWKDAIERKIRECDYFLALLSKSSVDKRGFVQKELRLAIEVLQEIPPHEVFLIPVRLDDCQPSEQKLADLHWIDLFPDYQEGLNGILRTLLPKGDQVSDGTPLGPGLLATARIQGGQIRYYKTSLDLPALTETVITVREGVIERDAERRLVVRLRVQSPFRQVQETIEHRDLDQLFLISNDSMISVDASEPTLFVGEQTFVLPRGDKTLDPVAWKTLHFEEDVYVHAREAVMGFLEGHTFRGESRIIHNISGTLVFSSAEIELFLV